MNIYKYMKMYVEKYLCENIKIESRKIRTVYKKCI